MYILGFLKQQLQATLLTSSVCFIYTMEIIIPTFYTVMSLDQAPY